MKIFRRIRKELLSENKFSKYLIYAIGEIILVVIGILIALQVNTWSGDKKNRTREKIILNQIHNEFLSNKTQLDSIKISNEISVAGCDAIIGLMPFKQERSTLDSIRKYYSIIANVKTFNPSNGSIESLINSSSFDVIQNDTLRNLLVTWKDVYNDYREEEQYARDFQIWEFLPYLRKNTNFIDLYHEDNITNLTSTEFQNIWLMKRASHMEILTSIKEEQIERYVTEIIRLTRHISDQ